MDIRSLTVARIKNLNKIINQNHNPSISFTNEIFIASQKISLPILLNIIDHTKNTKITEN